MNRYRGPALALATGAAALSLAACTAGITTASSAPSHASTRPTAPATASTVSTVSVGGSIGSFPIPPGATVAQKITVGKQIEVEIGSVTPQNAGTFYTSALPQAGYKITSNDSGSSGNSSALGIEFTGHGYKGTISAASNVSGVSVGNSKDFLAILLTKQ